TVGVLPTTLTVTFLNALGGTNVPALTASTAGLTGGTSPNANVVANTTQTITIAGAPTGGTFLLVFNGVTTSPAISYSSTAATLQSRIQAALDGLTSIGAGNTL